MREVVDGMKWRSQSSNALLVKRVRLQSEKMLKRNETRPRGHTT